jgi:hypothetical protein
MRSFVAAIVLLTPVILLAQEKADKPPESGPPAGTWKVYMPFLGEEGTGSQARYLVKFSQKDGKWSGTVVSAAKGWPKATVEKVSVSDKGVGFVMKIGALPIACEVKPAKDGKASTLYGLATVRKRPTPIEMEPTTTASLDPVALLEERFAKEPPGHALIPMGLNLLGQSEARKLDPKLVKSYAEKVAKSAGLYGPSFQRDALLDVARTLNEEAGYEKIGLEYARRAEKTLDAKESPSAQKRVLDVLVQSLEKTKRDEEVKTVQARLATLDFRIKPKAFAGRKAKSDRVVLVELFTGAQCPPCVAADLAFDALGKSYKPSEVVLLQYHMHVPGPDPLTSPASVGRQGFYEDAIKGAPSMFFSGRPIAAGGGTREDAPEKYDEYLEAIDPILETPSGASLSLTATRAGPKLRIDAKVDKLTEVGDDIRLRVALVEETVHYKGRNGVPVHHQVVRAMPGGAEGTKLGKKTFEKTYDIDITAVRKELTEYLDQFEKKTPFPTKDRPLELKKLRVVAFVQSDKTGEVFQAVQVDIKEEAKKKDEPKKKAEAKKDKDD